MTIFLIGVIIVLVIWLIALGSTNSDNKHEAHKLRIEKYASEKEKKKLNTEIKDLEEQVEIYEELENQLTKEARIKIKVLSDAYDKKTKKGKAREILEDDAESRARTAKETNKYSINFDAVDDSLHKDTAKKQPPKSKGFTYPMGSSRRSRESSYHDPTPTFGFPWGSSRSSDDDSRSSGWGGGSSDSGSSYSGGSSDSGSSYDSGGGGGFD